MSGHPVQPATLTDVAQLLDDDPKAGRHARDYYEASAPTGHPSAATHLPTDRPGWTASGQRRSVPTFTNQSISQGGAQLYSGSIATATPQTFTMASPPAELPGFGVNPRISRW